MRDAKSAQVKAQRDFDNYNQYFFVAETQAIEGEIGEAIEEV